jgi:hypothetical protein
LASPADILPLIHFLRYHEKKEEGLSATFGDLYKKNPFIEKGYYYVKEPIVSLRALQDALHLRFGETLFVDTEEHPEDVVFARSLITKYAAFTSKANSQPQ